MFEDFDATNYRQQDVEDESDAPQELAKKKKGQARSHRNVDQNTRSRNLTTQAKHFDSSEDDENDDGKMPRKQKANIS